MIAGLGVRVAGCLVITALVVFVLARAMGGLPIWVIDVLLWGGIAGSVAWAIVRRRASRDRGARTDLDARARAAMLLPCVALLPGLVALLTSPRLQMSFHGYLHSSYVYQALEGNFPPENPLLADTPANDYWLFHVLLAGISHVLRVAPPVAAMFVNFLALGASLGAIFWLLRTTESLPRHPFAKTCAALVVLFGANLAGGVHAGVAALAGEPAGDPIGISTMVMSGAARSAGLFPKFLNFNGFPLGIAFFLLALGGTVNAVRRATPAAILCAVTGVLGALAFHVTTGIFALGVLPAAAVIACLTARRKPDWALSRRDAVLVLVLGTAALVILLFYVRDLAGALGPSASVDMWNPANLRRFLGVTYPLWPFFVLGAATAFRNRRVEAATLSCVGVLGALAACITVLPDGNQYKFDYLANIAIALVALVGLRDLLTRGPALARVARSVATIGVALVLANVLVQGIAYGRSDLAAQDTLAYDGVNVVGDGPNSGAWEWIAANTSPDAVVVVPVVGSNRAPVLAMSRRSAFALNGGPFTADTPEFSSRDAVAQEIYDAPGPVDTATGGRILAGLHDAIDNRPVIVAFPFGYPDTFELEGALVYDEDGVRLYRFTLD